MWRAGGQGPRLACGGGGARPIMCGAVLPLRAAQDHRSRLAHRVLFRFAATSTRTTPWATATATPRKGEWPAASLVVCRAIAGRPGAAGVLAEDMEGAVGAVGRLLASPHARDQEAGCTLATDLLARQPLPPMGGGAPSGALLASARCSPSVLQAIATNSPAEALAALKRVERSGHQVSVEAVNGLVRGCLDGGNAVAAQQLFDALRQHLLRRGTTPDSATYALGIEAVGRSAKLPEVRALIDEVLQRSVPLDGKLLASMLTALAHKEAYDDALRLRRQLQTAHPHLASPSHAPDVQRGLISASAVKGDLRTCLEAAHELQRLMRAPPDLNTLTTILQCYSRSSLFEQEHGMLLRYLASLRSLDPAHQKEKEATGQLLASGTEASPPTTTGGGRAEGASWQDVIQRALASGPASKAGAPSSSDPGDGALHLLEEILRSEGSFLGEQLTLRQFNPAIYALVRLGQVDRALALVEDIQTHGLQPDIATHNTILKGFALRGDAVGAVRYYNAMLRKGVKPTTKTFEALLRAQSEVVAREVGSLQPAALVTAQLYNFDESNVLRAASPGHIQDAYSQLLLEMQAHGVKPKAQFLSSLVYGMCLTGLVEAALPLVVSALQGNADESGRGGRGRGVGGAWLRQERADVKLFNQLLLGISLQPQPSLDMTAHVLEMMEGAGVMPNQHTYTTLINVYANFTQHTAFPRGPTWLSPRNAPELREAGREAFMKALSVYFSMRRQHLREQASSPSSSARGVPTATFNSLVKLVGTEDLLDVSCHDIDHLHDELLLLAAHHDHAPASPPAQQQGGHQQQQQQQQDEAEVWTRLPLAELQKRYAERPLPLPAYLPAERTASQMTPLELLAWRDLAANGAIPDRVTYNHLIFNLTASGRLPHAEHYLRFLLHHHHHHHSPPSTHENPSSAAASSIPAAQAAVGSGGGERPDFLGRQLNPKYSSYLIKQRNDRRAQFAKLLAKTPPAAAVVGTAHHAQQRQQKQQQEEAHDPTDPTGDVFGFDEAPGAEAGAHHHPLFLRTLWRVGEEYLRTHRFDDFVECYRLARQSYPVSATKCFGFLLRAWRTPASPDLVPDASAEYALRQALSKHAMSDPEAAPPPSSAPLNALFQ